MLSRLHSWWRRAGWDDFVLIFAVVTMVVGLRVFFEMAEDAPQGHYLATERTIMQAFRHADSHAPIGPSWLPDTVRDLTALASAAVLILFALLILGYLLLNRQYAAAALIAVSIAGGEALNTLLKEMFVRARPDFTSHLVEVKTSSFPSGHAMAASIFYLTMGAVLSQTTKRRRQKIYITAAAVLLTLLTGLSRVYLGVHYPSDVLAGWSAGTAWAIMCWLVARWLRRRGALRQAQPDTPR
ncbi:MAG TPA: phosphatase PAP2 family protein [Opitutaceae bacterium]|nr:phosphatase PAP2 family protein [Opitutaceae bacterium]